MKNILLIILIIFSSRLNAQFEKGDWFLGASSSNINFNSSTNSENIIDVTFTGFRDTLVNQTDSLNLGFLFPYSYKLNEDKKSEFNANFKVGYFVLDKLMIGIGFGYENESSIFKTNSDDKVSNASIDSLTSWFTGLPDFSNNGSGYLQHYYEIYGLISSSVNNDLTFSKTLLTFSPYARYNFQLKKGNSFFLDGSYIISTGTEDVKIADNSSVQSTELFSSKINMGLGFTAFLSNKFSVEPQFNYFLYESTSKIIEDEIHPILTGEIGQKSTDRSIKGSGINFAVGLSFYF